MDGKCAIVFVCRIYGCSGVTFEKTAPKLAEKEGKGMKHKQTAVVASQKEIAPQIFDMWITTELAAEA